jgi:hypothetical protein
MASAKMNTARITGLSRQRAVPRSILGSAKACLRTASLQIARLAIQRRRNSGERLPDPRLDSR